MGSQGKPDGELTLEELSLLRTKNVIESDEIAFRFGDIYVAENVVTRVRRQLYGVAPFLNEGRRVLNG